jgi:23S rRNA (cytosine1962-C5)-methyltransferase
MRVTLKKGREKPIVQGHPWVFSGAIERVQGPSQAALAEVYGSQDQFLGLGLFSPQSQISVRMLTTQKVAIDSLFFEQKLQTAWSWRRLLYEGTSTNAFRWINSEGDGLSGLIVDCFGPVLAVQFLSAGLELYRQTLLPLLMKQSGATAIFERSDSASRLEEGLEKKSGWIVGSAESPIEVCENEKRFLIDFAGGQKTGFFLDQKENRQKVSCFSSGRTVLDLFCYSGGFSIYAAKAGAREIVSVDASSEALALVSQNAKLNHVNVTTQEADVFDFLRQDSRLFDEIILDPPAFAKKKADLERGCRGYKDVNRLAFQKLSPGGLLWTFSCSQQVDRQLFQQIVFAAAYESKKTIQVVGHLDQAKDHPYLITHLEGQYLKGLVCRVL